MFTDTETEAFQVKLKVLPPSWPPPAPPPHPHSLSQGTTIVSSAMCILPVIFCPCICILHTQHQVSFCTMFYNWLFFPLHNTIGIFTHVSIFESISFFLMVAPFLI